MNRPAQAHEALTIEGNRVLRDLIATLALDGVIALDRGRELLTRLDERLKPFGAAAGVASGVGTVVGEKV